MVTAAVTAAISADTHRAVGHKLPGAAHALNGREVTSKRVATEWASTHIEDTWRGLSVLVWWLWCSISTCRGIGPIWSSSGTSIGASSGRSRQLA
jgi:hypothetical protein